jgi:hypothetical protein
MARIKNHGPYAPDDTMMTMRVNAQIGAWQ